MPSSAAHSSTGTSTVKIAELLVQAFTSHCSANAFGGNVRRDKFLHHFAAHVGDGILHRLVLHQFAALFVDRLALIVHHIVEFQQVFADVEIPGLDFLLRLVKRLVDPGMRDCLAFLRPRLWQNAVRPFGAPKMRIRSSSSDRKNFEAPGSP